MLTPVTVPWLTPAIAVEVDDQNAVPVTSLVEPSLYSAVAVSSPVSPLVSSSVAGMTRTPVREGAVTRSCAVPLRSPVRAVTVTVPATRPVAMPEDGSIEAIESPDVDQVTPEPSTAEDPSE